MSKKPIALLLAACIVFCLSACNTAKKTKKQQTVTSSESKTNIANSSDETELNEKVQSPANTEEDENYTSQTQATVSQSEPSNSANKPTHIHNYSSATCTLPKTCSCGAKVGSALGHNFSAANCNSPKTCTRCGQTLGSALGHKYVNNKCSQCGKVDPASLPVRLNNLHLIDSSYGNAWHKYEYISNTFTDSFGNVYDGAHCYKGILNEGQYSTHNLNGQYSNFTGSIVATPNTSTAGTYSISIYVDGILKYSKSKFSKTTGKVDFSVNVKGGTTLTIKACMDSGNGDSNMDVAVVNAQLIK